MIDQAQAMDLPRQISTGEPYPLRGLVGFGLNYRMCPDSNGLPGGAREARLRRATSTSSSPTRPSTPTSSCRPAARWSGARCAAIRRSTSSTPSRSSNRWASPGPTPTSSSAWPRSWGCDYQSLRREPPQTSWAASSPNGAPDFGAAFDAALDWILEPSGMTMAELKAHPGGMPVPNPLPVALQEVREERLPHAQRQDGVRLVAAREVLRPPGHRRPARLPRARAQPESRRPTWPRTTRWSSAPAPGCPCSSTRARSARPWTRSLRPRRRWSTSTRPTRPATASSRATASSSRRPTGAIQVKANVTELARAGRGPHVPRLSGGRRQHAAPRRLPRSHLRLPGLQGLALRGARRSAPAGRPERRG